MTNALHVLIYNTKNELFTFGCNNFGQLGTTNLIDAKNKIYKLFDEEGIRSIHTGWHHTLILKKDGLYAIGRQKKNLKKKKFKNKKKNLKKCLWKLGKR